MRAWPSDLDERAARRGLLLAALINLVGSPLDLVVGRSLGLRWWPPLVSAAVGGAIAVYVLVARRPLRGTTASLVFIANAIPIVAALWLANVGYTSAHWLPFQANKLGALIVAFCAPQLWSGVLCIAAFLGTAGLQLSLLAPASRPPSGNSEWMVLGIFGAVAVVLLLYRLRSRALERAALRAQSEAAAMAASAGAYMVLSDLANTPLQTIELSVALLRAGVRDPGPSLLRIERALVKLRDLSVVLRSQESGPAGKRP